MTLVWKTQLGSLVQTQVSTMDVVNTYSAARAVYGWMGGMDGAQFLLSRIPNPFGRRIKELRLDQSLRLMPFQGHVFTTHGPLVAHLENARESFGGDIRTQVIGTTLCALAHECEALTAVRLFCEFLMPYLFGESSSITNALQAELMEMANLQKIINEGSSRGLDKLFIDTLAKLDLPRGNQRGRHTKLGEQDLEFRFLAEVNMVGGLLKWIGKDEGQEYRTRSGFVARVASCLKVVGYNIGSIQTWTGHGESPYRIDMRSLTLVLGGSSNTDPFMQDLQQIPDTSIILHYQFKTTGAMLLTAFGDAPDIPPEVLQEDFEQTFEYIEGHLTVDFTDGETGPRATFHWRKAGQAPTPIATRLASIYFSDSTEFVAPCYSRIATQDYLDGIRGKSKTLIDPNQRKLARFRAITACIAISITSRFAPSTFKHVHHATLLNLSSSRWLERLCPSLDRNYGDLPMPMVIPLLANFHAAHRLMDDDEMSVAHGYNVAWRNGIYGIVPSLLLNMKISRDDPQFVCIDYFWANVRVGQTGVVQSSTTPDILRYEIDIEHPCTNTNLSSLQRLGEPSLGAPEPSTPDNPLYLSLGTPLYNGEPDLCFVAWINGSVAGTVGISDVQRALLLSRVEPETCPGHDVPAQVINVKASLWAQDPSSKPISRDYPMFMPVRGDHCWAIFVAGQTVKQSGRIVYRCVDCAIENYVRRVRTESGSGGTGIFIGFL